MWRAFLYFCSILLFSCTSDEERLQGKWICVKNCDEIQTLTFSADSMEINPYLSYLRYKENTRFKFQVEDNKLKLVNTFYDERREDEFKFEFKNNTLLINSDITLVKMPENTSNFNVVSRFFQLNPQNISEISVTSDKRINTPFASVELIGVSQNGADITFNFKGNNIRDSALIWFLESNSRSNYDESEYVARYFLVDKTASAERVLKKLALCNKYSRMPVGVVCRKKEDLVLCNLGWLNTYNQGENFPKTLKNIYFTDSLINRYFTFSDENSRTDFNIINNEVYINNIKCKHHDEFIQKLNNISNPKINKTNFIKIDSSLFKRFQNEKKRHVLDESLLSEFNTIEKYLTDLDNSQIFYPDEIYIPVKNYYITLDVDEKSNFDTWLRTYTEITFYLEKLRVAYCKKVFKKNYYKLRWYNEEDLEIVKIVNQFYPYRFHLILKN